ncbi:B12-binding domain-containing radical SAM protein [Nanoarchaeota archaeon]
MKKTLLVYLPFCTPASPPYSLANLYSFLKTNSKANIDVLDLNLEFHKLKFPEFQSYYQDISVWENYETKTTEYNKLSSTCYSENNKKVVKGETPECFAELLNKIKSKKPDVVAFSIVYSSQAFYAHALLKELKEKLPEVKCVVGGPAVNSKLIELADEHLSNEIELLEYISGEKVNCNKLNSDYSVDFSVFDLKEYFVPSPIIPIKTSSTCFYKKCAFCSHFTSLPYQEYDLETIKKTIIDAKQKNFFLIDDMIPAKRLLKIAKILKPLNVKWTCQLRPTKDFDLETLRTLYDSGLRMVLWGVESGNERVLKLMNKGTIKQDVEQVLSDSHKAGIKNVTYIMFGFPTETKEEFMDTIEFLKRNSKNIDLISSSVFGLQHNTTIYNNPADYGITSINEEERTVLEPKITYEVKSGLTQKDASKLREKYKKTLDSINKYPKSMNYFREHMFCRVIRDN